MKAPKAGSRKAAIFDAFMSGGLEAAMKKAGALDIKPGTVKSWAGGWAKGGDIVTSAPRTGKPLNATARKLDKAKEFEAFAPHFKHTSRAQAAKHVLDICKRNRMRADAFNIIEDDGRFAVVPAHYKPNGPIPQFRDGDIVFDTIIPNTKGKIVQAGPQVSIVKYDKDLPSRPRECAIPNVYLYKFVSESKSKREKL